MAEVAAAARLSPSALHDHYKVVTSMTPASIPQEAAASAATDAFPKSESGRPQAGPFSSAPHKLGISSAGDSVQQRLQLSKDVLARVEVRWSGGRYTGRASPLDRLADPGELGGRPVVDGLRRHRATVRHRARRRRTCARRRHQRCSMAGSRQRMANIWVIDRDYDSLPREGTARLGRAHSEPQAPGTEVANRVRGADGSGLLEDRRDVGGNAPPSMSGRYLVR